MFKSILGRFSKTLKCEFKSFEVGVQSLWSWVLMETWEVSLKVTSPGPPTGKMAALAAVSRVLRTALSAASP
jgi:hypothetical protein